MINIDIYINLISGELFECLYKMSINRNIKQKTIHIQEPCANQYVDSFV